MTTGSWAFTDAASGAHSQTGGNMARLDSLQRAQPEIGNYGAIGDCRSAALVSMDGSIDWLCWPNFSSEPVFSRLLDVAGGGAWSIKPKDPYTVHRRYLGPTNVLETTFATSSSALTLTDFMPVADEAYLAKHMSPEHQITRILRCERGTINMIASFAPRADFDTRRLKIVDRRGLGLRTELKCGLLSLQSNLHWEIADGQAETHFSLNEGEACALILTYSSEGPAVLPLLQGAHESLQRTLRWWEEWSTKFSYTGRYAAAVQRSVLTLKLLQYAPTGAFIAAATTSLPERVGGKLNWDYRYCWLRDASFNLQALSGTGYRDEAEAFLEWMLHATRLTQPKLMSAYDLYGNAVPKEKERAGLSGYKASAPVRTGNLAGAQHQLDTYGEVICGAAQIIQGGGFADRETQRVLVRLGQFVAQHWQEPDAGIWESRDEPIVNTHSRLLCWVAMEELLKMHSAGTIEKMPVELFERTRHAIRQDLEDNCWSEELGSYTAEAGKSKTDATLLLFALHNFAEPGSDRLQRTYSNVTSTLRIGDRLLLRNLPERPDAKESAFGICGFWEAQFLAMGGGSLASAEAHFEHLLSYSNDLGLFAEEIDPASGAAVGNFPQTFTHVGLISAALAIEKRKHPDKETSACTA
jgi:GH15 family glucan-1,4-alpha-glucosidase